MTIGELKGILEYYDEDMEVVFHGGNSGGYVDEIRDSTATKNVRAFWGNNFRAVVLYGEQVGMVG